MRKLKASSHRCRPPRLLWVSPVDPGQQVTQLRRRDRYHAVGRARPQEATPFQPLGEQARPLAVMPDHLQQIPATSPEAKQMAAQRVAMQNLLDLQRQACKALPHVGVAGRKPHPYAGRERDHCDRPPASAATAAVRTDVSTAPVIRIRAPLVNSISMVPPRAR